MGNAPPNYLTIENERNRDPSHTQTVLFSSSAVSGLTSMASVCSMEPKVFLRRFFDKIHSKISIISRIGTEVSVKIKILERYSRLRSN